MRLQLLSDSCTTGWAHWGHGELWLTPESIVRIPKRGLTLAAAGRGAAAGLGAGAAGALAREIGRASRACVDLDIERSDWDAYLASYPAHLQVDMADLVGAHLRAGLTTSRLRLVRLNAPRVKLLWMRNETAVPALHAALQDRLD